MIGRRFIAAASALLCACGEAPDDNDGGRLNIPEEQRVQDWIRRLAPVIESVSQIDWTDADPERVEMLMNALGSTHPPEMRNNNVGRSMREFHNSLRERAETVSTLFERLNANIGMLTDFRSIERMFQQMETTQNRVRNLATNMSSQLAADFQDNPSFLAQLQATTNLTTRLFSASSSFGGLLPGFSAPQTSTRVIPPLPSSGATTSTAPRTVP